MENSAACCRSLALDSRPSALDSSHAQSPRTLRLQELCRSHAVRVSARHLGRRRAERLRQIEHRRRREMGARLAERQVAARQGNDRRHFQRLRHSRPARHRRSDAHARQRATAGWRSTPRKCTSRAASIAAAKANICSTASRAGCATFANCWPAPASPPRPTASSSRARSTRCCNRRRATGA